jgi:hypothetical protein
MDWLSFTASLVHSLAWPAAIVIAVIVLKERLAGLLTALGTRIADLTKLSAMGVNLEFEKGAESLNRAAEELAPANSEPATTPGTEEARLLQLADLDPRAAVLLGFIDVEAALRRVADNIAPPISGRRHRAASVTSISKELVNRGIITQQAASVLTELAVLRNQVSHDSDVRVSKGGAEQYIQAALEMIQFLSSLPNFDAAGET